MSPILLVKRIEINFCLLYNIWRLCNHGVFKLKTTYKNYFLIWLLSDLTDWVFLQTGVVWLRQINCLKVWIQSCWCMMHLISYKISLLLKNFVLSETVSWFAWSSNFTFGFQKKNKLTAAETILLELIEIECHKFRFLSNAHHFAE